MSLSFDRKLWELITYCCSLSLSFRRSTFLRLRERKLVLMFPPGCTKHAITMFRVWKPLKEKWKLAVPTIFYWCWICLSIIISNHFLSSMEEVCPSKQKPSPSAKTSEKTTKTKAQRWLRSKVKNKRRNTLLEPSPSPKIL